MARIRVWKEFVEAVWYGPCKHYTSLAEMQRIVASQRDCNVLHLSCNRLRLIHRCRDLLF
jgi:hypothetical protein